MRIVSYFMTFAAVLLLSFTPAAAAEKKTVPANKSTGITFVYLGSYSDYNCMSSGSGKVRLSREPQHGKVHTKWMKIKGNFKGGCKGRTMNGLGVWYTPSKNYRGPDDFKFSVSVPGLAPGATYNAGRSFAYKITVE